MGMLDVIIKATLKNNIFMQVCKVLMELDIIEIPLQVRMSLLILVEKIKKKQNMIEIQF